MGMISYSRIVFVAALMGFYLSGCGKPAVNEEEILVSIGDTDVTVTDFNERVSNLPERYREIAQKRKAAYVQELINDTLLYQEAIRKGLDKDEEVIKVFDEARKKILVAKLLSNEIESVIEMSDEEIEEFYTENEFRYMTPEVMRASHILVNSAEDAGSVIEELKSGAGFEKVARERSLDPTAQKGGDIGYFPKGQLMPEFEQACSFLQVGETSGVVKTSLGYHVIKLTDRRPPTVRPLDEVKGEIFQRLREVKRRDSFNVLLEKLKSSTEIKVNEKALSIGDEKEDAEFSNDEVQKDGGMNDA
jgi:peptidyl-prolyl cis-trans isomerase C